MATEHRLKNPGGERPEEFDRDVDIRALIYTGVGLAAIAAVSFVLMWFFVGGLASFEERRDPEPSPMPEASQPVRPAGPTLQATPERDLEELLVLERTLLETYGVSVDGETARIPIERAMELALERGLGTPGGAVGAGYEAVPAGTVEGDRFTPLGELAPDTEPTSGEGEERPDSLIPDRPEGPGSDGR